MNILQSPVCRGCLNGRQNGKWVGDGRPVIVIKTGRMEGKLIADREMRRNAVPDQTVIISLEQ
jgi:hypothetical protein